MWGPRPYGNPYVAGLLLGATLLASFLCWEPGWGPRQRRSDVGALIENAVAPEHAQTVGVFWRQVPGRWRQSAAVLPDLHVCGRLSGRTAVEL